jgi:nitrite reductase/ring-hydroxylating ferredoxin subunit
MAKFVKVGRVDDLAEGQATVAQVDGQRIAIFHAVGHYYALEASCPHEGGPLADGVIEGLHIICPWHGYDFHLKTGECGLDPDIRALTYPIKVQDDDLLIEVA